MGQKKRLKPTFKSSLRLPHKSEIFLIPGKQIAFSTGRR